MTKYLLDVNVLVALGIGDHEFHTSVAMWLRTLSSDDELMTCAITELAFVRVLAQLSQTELSIAAAKALLLQVKLDGAFKFTFLMDDLDATRLPGWVKTPKQTTDGHLAALAKANDATFATLDRSIPGAFLIPQR
jgi:predicted nucleic acid-binding protein